MKRTVSTFLKSYLLQGFWNYTQMQNIGLLYIILPHLKEFYKGDAEAYKRAVARNLESFNSNPVLSTYSIGAMIKHEEKISQTPAYLCAEEERELRIIRASTSNTAASIGDRLFWATLKPLSLVICFFVIFGSDVEVLREELHGRAVLVTAVLALLGSLLIYNIPAVVVRFKGLVDSYNGTEDNFYGLINLNWNKIIYFLKTLGQIFTVFVIFYGLYISFRGTSLDADSVTRLSLLTAFIVLSVFMKKLNIPNIFLYLTATAVFGIASFLA
jgi:PTS system mannose-specific IID component